MGTSSKGTVLKRRKVSRSLSTEIAAMFAGGQLGGVLAPWDLSTLHQDVARTIPVTAVDDPIGSALLLHSGGLYVTQSTDALRPVLKQDASGNRLIRFNGTTQFLTRAFAPVAYPLVLAAAAKAGADQEGGVLSANASVSAYKALFKNATANTWYAVDRNVPTHTNLEAVGTNATPHTLVAEFDTSFVNLRMDTVDTNAATANTNTFGPPTTLYIGQVRSTGILFNGDLYAGFIRAGAVLTAIERSAVESYLAATYGAVL